MPKKIVIVVNEREGGGWPSDPSDIPVICFILFLIVGTFLIMCGGVLDGPEKRKDADHLHKKNQPAAQRPTHEDRLRDRLSGVDD
jgi:hypothetical protein